MSKACFVGPQLWISQRKSLSHCCQNSILRICRQHTPILRGSPKGEGASLDKRKNVFGFVFAGGGGVFSIDTGGVLNQVERVGNSMFRVQAFKGGAAAVWLLAGVPAASQFSPGIAPRDVQVDCEIECQGVKGWGFHGLNS